MTGCRTFLITICLIAVCSSSAFAGMRLVTLWPMCMGEDGPEDCWLAATQLNLDQQVTHSEDRTYTVTCVDSEDVVMGDASVSLRRGASVSQLDDACEEGVGDNTYRFQFRPRR